MGMKVFLAEDEEWIRKGIKKMVSWEELGLELYGEADDGQAALDAVLEIKPDILLTDIRMPSMDGLSLAKAARQHLSDLRVVIISGYKEFDYAREALKMEVIDYILKPIDKQELNCVLKKATELILEEKKTDIAIKELREENSKNITSLRKSFLIDLLEERISSGDIEGFGENLDKYGISKSRYTCAVISLAGQDSRSVHISPEFEKAVSEVYYPGIRGVCINKSINEAVVILISERPEEEAEIYLNRLCSELSAAGIDEFFVGIGEIVEDICKIPFSYNSAKKALLQRTLDLDARIFHCNKTKHEIPIALSSYISELKLAVELNDVHSIKKQIDLTANDLRKTEGATLKDLKNSFLTISFDIIKLLHERSLATGAYYDRCYEFINNDGAYTAPDNIRQWMVSLLTDAVSDISNSKKKNADRAISQIRDYVDSHYSEDISLNSLSNMVYMNPAYLSSMFKQLTGENYIDYVSRVRIDKARELLRNKNIGVGEAAGLVGYDDIRYFSKVFKKNIGCSPSEYKESMNDREIGR